jgi:hypothetical protein
LDERHLADRAGDAVATVQDDPQRPRRLEQRGQVGGVLRRDGVLGVRALAGAESARVHQRVDLLDLLRAQRHRRPVGELEPGPAVRVVAGRDADPGEPAQRVLCEVDGGRGRQAEQGDPGPGRQQTQHQRVGDRLGVAAGVEADDDALDVPAGQEGAEGPADAVGHELVERIARVRRDELDRSPDVILPEEGRFDLPDGEADRVSPRSRKFEGPRVGDFRA